MSHATSRPRPRRQPDPRLPLLSLCLVAAGLGFALATTARAAELPPGFAETTVAADLDQPTAMAISRDGRIFVCEQTGKLRVVKSGHLLARPFVVLGVNSEGERGLLGVALHPDFPHTPYVYLYYTALHPKIHNRVSRFTAKGDRVLARSEVVLLDLPALGPTNHNGGGLHFGPEGALYIGVGENANGANSQSLETPLGKLLRIAADGHIPHDNPFFAGHSGLSRAIWALGLRNPYTFAFASSGRLFIDDVGQSTWEEIDVGVAGANYGWPVSEGPTDDPDFHGPLFAYGHGDGSTTGCAITGGTFYEPAHQQFPAQYQGQYFFSDLCSGWIRVLDPDTAEASDFASGIALPVDLAVSADGSLYYLSHQGALRQVTFGGS